MPYWLVVQLLKEEEQNWGRSWLIENKLSNRKGGRQHHHPRWPRSSRGAVTSRAVEVEARLQRRGWRGQSTRWHGGRRATSRGRAAFFAARALGVVELEHAWPRGFLLFALQAVCKSLNWTYYRKAFDNRKKLITLAFHAFSLSNRWWKRCNRRIVRRRGHPFSAHF